MFRKVLIANRGEIACRVVKTCRRLGVATVAVYSDSDRNAKHVSLADEAMHIGGSRPNESYLRGDKIIAAARQSGAQAIHPGYGFLSENADFARACAAANLVFIGPTPDAIDRMGSKSAAKAIMEKAGVPVVPGYHGDNQDPTFLRVQADKVGYPLMIKAVAGGGGKGMRLTRGGEDFLPQLEAARREAANAFGDERVLIERYVSGPHHIEFQVFGDKHGNAIHLFERECSIQRRHQKILEETPSPFLDEVLRARMADAAVRAARAIGYVGAGTIEFIVGEDRQFYFMEMNTRLQVEHPVTEMTTGHDLVEWQLRVAAGEPLPRKQDEILRSGHAIEVRVCAEAPMQEFMPQAGVIQRLLAPKASLDVRLDMGVREGDEIGVYYDSMIAKLIVRGEDRDNAIARLQQALVEFAVVGVKTNLELLERIASHPAFQAGKTDTGFVERYRDDLLNAAPQASVDALVVATAQALVERGERAAASARASADPHSPWHTQNGWRLNADGKFSLLFSDPLCQRTHEVVVTPRHGNYDLAIGEQVIRIDALTIENNRVRMRTREGILNASVVQHRGHFSILLNSARWELFAVEPFTFKSAEEIPGGRLTALMPGRIVRILVASGDAVTKGQPLLVMEAMKMEHTIHSPRDGTIERVHYRPDDIVQEEAVLFSFAEQT